MFSLKKKDKRMMANCSLHLTTENKGNPSQKYTTKNQEPTATSCQRATPNRNKENILPYKSDSALKHLLKEVGKFPPLELFKV